MFNLFIYTCGIVKVTFCILKALSKPQGFHKCWAFNSSIAVTWLYNLL